MAGVSVSTPSKENSPTYGLSKTGAALTDKAQLNIASSILTQDVIDGLKKADESVQVKPLTLKIDKNTKKQADITALTTLVSNLKTSYADVANETAMLKRTVSAAGSGSVTASVEAGVAEQTVRLSVSQLAQVDSYQSKGFNSRSDTLTGISSDQSLTLSVGDKSVDIKVGASTTLEDIINQINDGAGDVLKASIVNTGGENGYKMILQSKESGEKNQIKFSVKGDQTALQGAQDVLKELGFNTKAEEIKDDQGKITGYNLEINTVDTSAGGKQLQKAQDAKFNFNGIDITRSSNKVDDLIIGVTFNLNNVDEKNSTTGALKESVITIGKDTDAVVKSLKSMVTAYNDLISNITTATSYDRDNDVAGTLNGMSEITGIKRKLQNLFESSNSDGKSLQSFGFSFTEKGVLSVDESKLKDAINKDYEGFKSFFTNSTEYKNAGVFGKVQINQTLTTNISGKLKINGKEIQIDLKATNGAVKNANELVKLINDADIPNVKARLADNGVLQLIGTSGKDIEISKDSDSTLLKALGLTAGTTPGSSTKKKGFFDKLGDIVTGLIGKEGTLTNLTTSLKDKAKITKSQKDKVQATLDKKYTMMQKQFSTIAVQMNALENSFNSLKNTFDAMLNSNK
ncbi:MAG: flagellar filament capping protein FliD [Campylobacter sp.]|uniref:flagellar filament capping protein FliD n=1 Tax=Campylobacter sp. TaxID=205 RepID=UPI002AA7F901|nr:flagellar filament capping protein FliD [Campylobacter sp.]MCI6178458.1 flagellar filament capping protein FliD [Campylobacter sp.]